jgi:bicarbonate transport system permease protein
VAGLFKPFPRLAPAFFEDVLTSSPTPGNVNMTTSTPPSTGRADRPSPTGIALWWKNNRKLILPPLFGIGGFLLFWQLSASLGLTKLAGPLSLFTEERTRELLFYPFFDRGGLDKGLFLHAMSSLSRVALGYTLAAVVGIAVGIAVGLNKALDRACDPLFQFLRMVAPLAWVPIALVLFQNNQPAAIFVIFITSIWPILINTAEGVRQIPQDYRNVALVLQMSSRRFFTKVLIPSTVPYIFTGLRISIGLAWLAIIAAEIVMPGTPGIGFFIWDAYQNSYVSDIVLGVIWIGAIGLILDRFMTWLQKRISAQ